MSSCVLCGVDIVKNTDKNLVDGRRGNSFKVREELLSLKCKVEINSTYICRKIVQSKKCSAVPLPVPKPSSNQISDSQEQATKRVALEDCRASVTSVDIEEDNTTSPNRTSVDQWPSTLTSTPCKEKNRPVAFAAVVGPVSPIPAREPEEKKTRVQVTVEWPSRTKVNTLHEGLESLGKMLCRGTFLSDFFLR